MNFGKLVLDRPLLALLANQGCKYVIARDAETRQPWFVSVDPDGSMGGQRADRSAMGASTRPFETWIAGGQLPEGARSVEVELDGERYPAKVRAGFWLVGIPWGNRDREGVIRFENREGELVKAEPFDLWLAPRPPR
jgi:hypothetical protein